MIYKCICIICGRSFKSVNKRAKICPPLYDRGGKLIRDCHKIWKKKKNDRYWKDYYEDNKDWILQKNRDWWKNVGKPNYKSKRKKRKTKS